MRRPTSLLVVLTALLAALVGTLAETTSAEAARPRLLIYGGREGVVISSPAQASRKLPGAPPDFQRFIARYIGSLPAVDPCTGASPSVLVWRVRTDGFAHGIMGECSGGEVLWKRSNGRWRAVLAYQDFSRCSVLRRLSIPSAVMVPNNWCYSGTSAVRYRHA